MARMTDVEVRKWYQGIDGRRFGWQVISVVDGLRLRDETFRCPECHGRVKLTSASETFVAHGEHFQRNKGCSLGDCFDGEKRVHPQAIS